MFNSDDSNYVRATEPAVARRLNAMVQEVVARLGLDEAIAFADWENPGDVLGQLSQQAPFGYAMPDRLRVLREKGYDPIDQPLPQAVEFFNPRSYGRWVDDNQPKPTPDSNASKKLVES